MANELGFRIPPGSNRLPDNAQWELRFEIKSESSGRIYVVSRNKDSGKWGCSCPSYKTRRYCKHLTAGCGLMLSQIHGNAQFEEKRRDKMGY
jgi:hypothetical protein